jgi:hypothetical protein
MGSISRSLVSFAALLGTAPLAFAAPTERLNFIPRQASPGFSGCSYPSGWTSCNDENNRDCWVKDPSGKEYNIKTDYEDDTPTGKLLDLI